MDSISFKKKLNKIVSNNEKKNNVINYQEIKYYQQKNDINKNENNMLQKSIELNSFNPGTSPNNNSFMDKLNIRVLMY